MPAYFRYNFKVLSVIFNYLKDDGTMETNYKVLPVNDTIATASHKGVRLS